MVDQVDGKVGRLDDKVNQVDSKVGRLDDKIECLK